MVVAVEGCREPNILRLCLSLTLMMVKMQQSLFRLVHSFEKHLPTWILTVPPLNHPSRNCFAIAISQSLIVAGSAQAATIDVSGGCTLADAITAANTDTATGACIAGDVGADIINIPNQTIAFSGPALGAAQKGPTAFPLISSQVTIQGNNSTIERVGELNMRFFGTVVGNSAALLTIDALNLVGGGLSSGNYSQSYGGAVYVGSNSTVTVTNSNFSGNSAYFGAAIYAGPSSSLMISDSTISNNSAFYGGMVYASYSAVATIQRTAISNNQAAGSGGGISIYSAELILEDSTVSDNSARESGGGILVGGLDSQAQIQRTTISGNHVTENKGGGIFSYRASLNIVNSTLSGNSATVMGMGVGPGKGGALYPNASYASLINVTIANNYGQSSIYAAGNANYPASISLNNSVIAGSSQADCQQGALFTTITADDAWFEDASCDGQASGDARLGPLADNGGLTLTHRPASNSGLIERGDPTVCAAMPVSGIDQRGAARGSSSCTLGAVEEPGSANFVIPTQNGNTVIIEL